jgi:hypothetical protein
MGNMQGMVGYPIMPCPVWPQTLGKHGCPKWLSSTPHATNTYSQTAYITYSFHKSVRYLEIPNIKFNILVVNDKEN